MPLLAIETSCDETAAAIVDSHGALLSSIIRSQEKLHATFGGIVPEVASRAHTHSLLSIIEQALSQAQLDWSAIEAIAVTQGPGLNGCLMVGTTTAKAIALSLQIPLLGIDHLEAHIAAAYIHGEPPQFPLLALIVSGGHSAIYRLEKFGAMELIASTRDDAMGEAYDKVASLLSLGYPGGAKIDALAQDYSGDLLPLPSPMENSRDLDFSFSGLKTAVANYIQKNQRIDSKQKRKIAASFQQAAIKTVITKLRLALKHYPQIKQLVVCGGVACNQSLRQQLKVIAQESAINLRLPLPQHCTDNAAMVAWLANYYFRQQLKISPLNLATYTNYSDSPVLVA